MLVQLEAIANISHSSCPRRQHLGDFFVSCKAQKDEEKAVNSHGMDYYETTGDVLDPAGSDSSVKPSIPASVCFHAHKTEIAEKGLNGMFLIK